VSGVDIAQKTIWLKGERCSKISSIKQPSRDVFDLVPPIKAVRLITLRSIYQEAVLESITII
jgi:hypothetical protein